MDYQFKVAVTGSWNAGYRPKKIRVTGENADATHLWLYDVNGDTITSTASYSWGEELDIPPFNVDIGALEVWAFGDGINDLYIDSIEFYQ